MLFFCLTGFASLALAEKCYSVSDESGNSGNYTASGEKCGSSTSVGGVGDWQGVDSIGAWLGLLLIVGAVFWFVKTYLDESKKK